MKDLLLSIFGEYVSPTYVHEWAQWDEVTGHYIVLHDTVIPSGGAGIDWPFVLGVVIFIVSLYCVLRIIGAVINRV